ncbi:MAG: DinB family protein [Candidatus Thorarchaeota archaeon]
MDMVQISNSLKEQYGAAFKTLENIINSCPDEIWVDSPSKPPIFGVVHHTLFFVDLYFSKTKEERTNYKPRFPDDKDDLFMENPLSKEDLLKYIDDMKNKAKEWLSDMTSEALGKAPVFEWHGSTLLSSLLYNLRHIMLHIGALQVRLRHQGVKEKFWVSHATL